MTKLSTTSSWCQLSDDRHPERLSEESSGLPWFAVSQDGIEDDEELAHAGDKGLLAGFPGGAEFGVMRGDDRVLPAGDERSHVERGAHRRPATGDGAATAQAAAIAVDRGDTDQSSDLATGEPAEFGQIGNQGTQRHLADAGHAGQQIGVALPSRGFADGLVN